MRQAIVSVYTPNAQILPAVWKLVSMRLRIMVNSFRHAKTRGKVATLVLYVMILGFGYFIFWLSRLLLGFVRSPEMAQYSGLDLTAVLGSLPALILSALFIGTLLTSFGVLLQALYLS
jgi:hypothetical protein